MELNNSTNGMKEAQPMLGKQVSEIQMQLAHFSQPKTPTRRPRAQPPARWSLRVDLPLVRESLRDVAGATIRAGSPEDIAKIAADIASAPQEAFIVIDLNARNNVIDKRLVSLGLLDASLVHPREVFRGAIVNNAAAVVVCHNHPSGDPTPSAEDVRITRQLVAAGNLISIRVLDHVIIGRANATGPNSPAFLSLRESGLVDFTT